MKHNSSRHTSVQKLVSEADRVKQCSHPPEAAICHQIKRHRWPGHCPALFPELKITICFPRRNGGKGVRGEGLGRQIAKPPGGHRPTSGDRHAAAPKPPCRPPASHTGTQLGSPFQPQAKLHPGPQQVEAKGLWHRIGRDKHLGS